MSTSDHAELVRRLRATEFGIHALYREAATALEQLTATIADRDATIARLTGERDEATRLFEQARDMLKTSQVAYRNAQERAATARRAGFEEARERDLTWAVERWNAEVENRPLQNIHRRAIDTTWRRIIRHLGGDPDALVGPSHDALMDAAAIRAIEPVGGK